MNKWVAILLATLISVQSLHITMDDILNLDALMEHARFHKQEFGDDLTSFITKHYGSQQADHMDTSHEDKHEDLPFKHSFTHSHCPVALLSNVNFTFEFQEHLPRTEDTFYPSLHNKLFVIKAFQPPRQA